MYKRQELFCARDHFGIKPFYYYDDPAHFLFASEIKGFLDHPDFKKELNTEVLDIYLKMNYVAGEKTFFKNVKQLLPGHYLIYKDQKIQIKRYYHRIKSTTKKSPRLHRQELFRLSRAKRD